MYDSLKYVRVFEDSSIFDKISFLKRFPVYSSFFSFQLLYKDTDSSGKAPVNVRDKSISCK